MPLDPSSASEPTWFYASNQQASNPGHAISVKHRRMPRTSALRRSIDACTALPVSRWATACSLSANSLWREQGRLREALGLLAPMYAWFTEGFDTPDLQEAQRLLDELSAEILPAGQSDL